MKKNFQIASLCGWMGIFFCFLGGSILNGEPLDVATKNYDQKHIRLEVVFNLQEKKISGLATIRCRMKKKSAYVRFHGKNLHVYKVTWKKKDLAFEYNGEILMVYLSKPMRKKGKIWTISIQYSAKPNKGLYFFYPTKKNPNIPMQVWSQGESENNRYWFPGYDKPDNRISSELIAYIQKDFTVISNGILLSKQKAKASKVKSLIYPSSTNKIPPLMRWHFSQKRSHVSYLISIVIGKFAKVKDHYKKIPLRYYVPTKWKKDAHFSFSNTPKMMKFFEEYTKIKYPWPKYDQITIWQFHYGGMENTGATTLNMRALHGKRGHLDYQSDGLVAHELAHQWFGDLLTCSDWPHLWLNEGFATYFTRLWFEHREGKESIQLSMYQNNLAYIKGTSKEKWEDFKRKKNTPIDLNDSYRAYTRGSAILHMLRFILRDDLFQKGIQEYLQTYKDKSITSENLRVSLEKVSKKDLSWFFEEWIYGFGFPVFEVHYEWKDSTKKSFISIEQRQTKNKSRTIFHIPVLLEIKGKNYRIVRKIFMMTSKKKTFF